MKYHLIIDPHTLVLLFLTDGATHQLGFIDRRMDVDDDIADAAGLERQVPLSRNKHLLTTSQCTIRSTSTQETEELLSSEVDRSVMQTLVNSLNKIELHTQNCEKCKQLAYSQKAWILDSGASQHFTNTKEDFIDFEIVKNVPKVKTTSETVLQIERQGAILLRHFVNIRGTQVVKTTRIYPVMYIPGLSAKLLSMGCFLQNRQEVHGNLKQITFHDAITHKPLLSAYPRSPWDTIYWVLPQEIERAYVATIFKVDYKTWHKRLGHPSKDVLKCAKELKDFPNDLVFPEHSPLCRGCAEGKMHSKSFPESDSQATKPFQLVHSDLKEFPIESYSKYKYIITFLDDYSSHAWIALLL